MVIGAGSAASTARADDVSQEDRTRARTVFQAGLALEAAGDWAKALQKFQEVASIKATPQTLFHQGRCLENLGRWTEALGMYRMAIDKADDPKLADVRAEADGARTALEARLPKLTIQLAPGVTGATVSLDGVALGASSLGAPMLVDPGTHRVTAAVPGRQDRIQREVVLAASEQKSLTIDFDAPARPIASTPAPIVEDEAGEPWIGIPKRTGYIIAGASAASVVVGGVFYYLRQGTINDLDDSCLARHCPSADESTADRGQLYTHFGNGFFLLGVLGGAFGTFVILKGQPEAEATDSALSPREVNLSFGAGQNSMGAHLTGVF